MFDENPYQSPVVSGKGEYDWTLAKRIFVVIAVLAFSYLIPAAVGSWQLYSRGMLHNSKPIVQRVIDFCSDWEH